MGVRGRGLSIITRLDETTQTNRLQQLHQLLIQPIGNLLPADPNARVIFIRPLAKVAQEDLILGRQSS